MLAQPLEPSEGLGVALLEVGEGKHTAVLKEHFFTSW